MPVPLTALLASAIYQTRAVAADPSALTRATDLLVRLAVDVPLSFEVADEGLLVGGLPVASGAPGATIVRSALRHHRIHRLVLPEGLHSEQWVELAVILGSAPGLYASPDQLLHALQITIPSIEILPAPDETVGDDLRDAIDDVTRRPEVRLNDPDTDPNLTSTNTERAELSTLLDPLLQQGKAAIRTWDWSEVALVLLGLRSLEERSDGATRSIIAQERRRVIPPDALRRLVRMLPQVGVGSPVARALTAMGRDGVEATLDVLADRPSRSEHRVYLETLIAARDAEPVLLESLGSVGPPLLRDIVEVIGRRRMELATPHLVPLLRHADEGVRTVTWHALERIGTPEALAALS